MHWRKVEPELKHRILRRKCQKDEVRRIRAVNRGCPGKGREKGKEEGTEEGDRRMSKVIVIGGGAAGMMAAIAAAEDGHQVDFAGEE